jgi:DNA-binding NarL/FixJ family response regulator
MDPAYRVSCLARIEPAAVDLLVASLAGAGATRPIVFDRINVSELGTLAPGILVLDIDGLEVDPIETLRMLRFVLPGCILAVYTDVLEEQWARACHLAGANCLLAKTSDTAVVSRGLRHSLASGCFTDPNFSAA